MCGVSHMVDVASTATSEKSSGGMCIATGHGMQVQSKALDNIHTCESLVHRTAPTCSRCQAARAWRWSWPPEPASFAPTYTVEMVDHEEGAVPANRLDCRSLLRNKVRTEKGQSCNATCNHGICTGKTNTCSAND